MRVRVRACRKQGFWAAGLFWPADWTEADLEPAKVELLKADAELRTSAGTRYLEFEVVTGKAKAQGPDVAKVQPAPSEPTAPSLFDDPVLRRKQEELLKADEKAKAKQGKAKGKKQPVVTDEDKSEAPKLPAPQVTPPNVPASNGDETKGDGEELDELMTMV